MLRKIWPNGVSSVSTPPPQLGFVAWMPARSSTSSEPKPVMVPCKARTSLSTAFELFAEGGVWPASTAGRSVSVAFVADAERARALDRAVEQEVAALAVIVPSLSISVSGTVLLPPPMPDTVPAPEIEPPAATSMLAAREASGAAERDLAVARRHRACRSVANSAPSSVPWPTIIWPCRPYLLPPTTASP